MKRVVKRFFIIISSAIYVWMLFLSVVAVEARLTFAQPAHIKSWLASSGVYDAIVQERSKQATIQQIQANALVQLTANDISQVALESFTPADNQADAEGLIDGVYGWLKGDTSDPQFKVDYTTRQAKFASLMTDKLQAQILALPECKTAGKFSVQAFDPFTAECRPKGADIVGELDSFKKDISSSKDIVPQQVITGSDLKFGGESIASALPWAQNAYKALLWGPIGVIVLTLLCILALIFLSTSRRRGVKRFAGGLVFVGVVMLASGLLLGPAFTKLNSLSSKSVGAEASFSQNIVDPIIEQMSKTYSRYNIIAAGALLIPALITYALLLMTRSKHQQEPTEVEQEYETEVSQQQTDPIIQIDETQPFTNIQPQPEAEVSQPMPMAQPLPQAQNLNPPVAVPPQRPVTRRPPMVQG